MRAQVEHPTLGVAFVLLTAALVLGLGAASNALIAADRPAMERQTAVGLSDRLVSEDATLTARENVLRAGAVEELNASTLREYGLPEESQAEIRLGSETVASVGDPTGGTTIERVVLVENRTTETLNPEFDDSRQVALPRRSANVTVDISPPNTTVVRSVRANGETVLRNESGLAGQFALAVSRLETTTLQFETAGPLDANSVEIGYETAERRKATLAVTVDE
jgi:hypothetical protein